MSEIFVIKGTSGSGKSSRVYQLVKYFESLGYKHTPLCVNVDNQQKEIGLYFEDLNIGFVGKKYSKNGSVERWQGIDSWGGRSLGGSENISDFLKLNKRKTIVLDGSVTMLSNRFRPLFLHNLGFTKIFIQHYVYTEKQDFLNRITLRTGKVPLKDSGWGNNECYIENYEKSLVEATQIDSLCELHLNEFDAPIHDFGVKFLESIGMGVEEINSFKTFVTEFNYINKNKF